MSNVTESIGVKATKETLRVGDVFKIADNPKASNLTFYVNKMNQIEVKDIDSAQPMSYRHMNPNASKEYEAAQEYVVTNRRV